MYRNVLFSVTALSLVLMTIPLTAGAALIVDRGLPDNNLNNAAGSDRSNVAWDFGIAGDNADQWIAGDDFSLPCMTCGKYVDYYYIDKISIWMIAGEPSSDFAVGDRYETISLFLGPDGPSGTSVDRVATANVTAGTNDTDNPNVQISAVQYPGTTTDYQGSGSSFIQIWQIDFLDLGYFAQGDYQFAAGGIGGGIPNWFNHASNAALSGTPQDQADDLYRWFSGNAGMESITFGNFFNSQGNGWDKSSDINIQVWGEVAYTRIPEPTTLALMGLGMFGLAALRRRRIARNPMPQMAG